MFVYDWGIKWKCNAITRVKLKDNPTPKSVGCLSVDCPTTEQKWPRCIKENRYWNSLFYLVSYELTWLSQIVKQLADCWPFVSWLLATSWLTVGRLLVVYLFIYLILLNSGIRYLYPLILLVLLISLNLCLLADCWSAGCWQMADSFFGGALLQFYHYQNVRVVRKFWSRWLSCQSKRPVQGYFI